MELSVMHSRAYLILKRKYQLETSKLAEFKFPN